MNQNLATIKLSNFQQMPLVGLGTFDQDEETMINIIKLAYKNGYRHFDTAQLYGNEELVGKAIKQLFEQGVKREDIFVTTKYFPYKNTNALEKLKESLNKLGLSYVDMYLLHWSFAPIKTDENGQFLEFQHQPVFQVWPVLEDCVKNGMSKGIGVSNFNCQSLLDLLSYCKIKPAINQVELHPYLTQKRLLEFCKKFGIVVTAFSPIARGGLQKKRLGIFGKEIDILNEPKLIKISQQHKKSIVQVVLRYLIQQGISVIPKTQKESRLIENISIFDFTLTNEEMSEIDSLNCNLRTVDPIEIKWWGNINAFD